MSNKIYMKNNTIDNNSNKGKIESEFVQKRIDWMIDWKTRIDEMFVRYVYRILNIFPQEKSVETTIDRSIDLGTNDCKKELNDIYIIYSSKKAVKFADIVPLRLYYTSYIIRFMIPNKHILTYETDRPGTEQKIEITNWSYSNCYFYSIKKILEDFGKFVYSLYVLGTGCPSVKNSLYDNFIALLDVKEAVKTLKNKD